MKNADFKHNRKYSIKRLLFAGLIVWLPIITSIWVINYIVSITDSLIGLLPPTYRPEYLLGFKIPGLGLIIAIIILLVTGLLATNVIGKNVIKLWDNIFSSIPFIKSVYFGVKKVAESILSDSRGSFKDPVLVQFPHQNSWTIGFVTSTAPASVSEGSDKQDTYLSVYIPTTPNPTSGYVVFVKKSDTRKINFTAEEALKYVVTFGIINEDTKINELGDLH